MAEGYVVLTPEQRFTNQLIENSDSNQKSIIWNREKYETILNKIKIGLKGHSSDYYHMQRFDVLHCGDVEKLIKKRQSLTDPILYYAYAEEIYSIIMRAHLNTGHGGRDKMLKEVNKKYANVTRHALNLFKEMCEECQLKKRKIASKGLVIKPLISKDFNSRAQVDLVDMQSMRDGDFRFIMHYQDHLTKFAILRALTSKHASEVAYQLLDIFLLFGAPHILQSDNGREFTANIIKELKDMWTDCTIVHGKPRHPQSQGSVERGNADIKDMLVIWMRENNSKKWNIGLKFVQFEKYNSHHSGINRSPYKAMFGCDAKIGLSSPSLPQEILGSLQTEEDLIQHLQISDKPDEISNDGPNELSSDKPNQLDEESQLNTALNLSETQETELDVHVCAVCENPCFSIIQCSTCAQYIHELCSNGTIPDTITCHLCSNEEVIRNERRHASDSMTKQAVRMRNLSERVLTEVDVGANVLVAIPHVDRGKGDPRNLMAVVTGKEEHGYKLGIKDGILRGLYTRNQFELSDSNFIAIHCVNYDNEISFRKAVSKVSLCDGQGYTKCGCSASGKTRCNTKRCLCKKSGQMCNSRCHPNITCSNK